MKCRRFCWIGLTIPLIVLLSPLILWLLVVLLAPTDWARAHVVKALEKSTGRTVHLDDLSVCFSGDIQLNGLNIGAPGSIRDPWLQARRVQIDVSPFSLFLGRFEPSYVEVDGGQLRVLRRENGSLELADLVDSARETGRAASSGHEHKSRSPLQMKLTHFRVLLIDVPTNSRIALDEIEGEGNCDGQGVFQSNLSGMMNQGAFDLTTNYDVTGDKPILEGQFRANDVVLDEGMDGLRYLIPILAGDCPSTQGRLSTNIYLRSQGDSKPTILRSLTGHGQVVLDPIELRDSAFLKQLARISDEAAAGHVGSIRSEFLIKNERISTERANVTLGKLPFALVGWTDFGGNLDYQVKLDGLNGRLTEKASRWLASLDVDFQALTSLRLSGNVNNLALELNSDGQKKLLNDMLSPQDQDKLRVIGRRLKDKILR